MKAEIRRRLSLIYFLKGDFTDGSRDAYEGLLSWLDTLKETPTWVIRAEQRKKDQASGKKFAIMEIRAEIEQLKEIHKGLLEGRFRSGYYAAFRQILAFLDTLKAEEKPAEWSEEDEDTYNRVYCLFRDAIDEWYKAIFMGCYPKITKDKVLAMLKNLHHQPKQEWSEKDKTMALTLMRDIEQVPFISKEGKNERIGWLNNLPDNIKPQSNWKPSEEQMDALMKAITWLVEAGNHTDSSILANLRSHLKELK